MNQPTWGVDASAAAAIRQALLDLAEEGSRGDRDQQDLDELMEISDRFAALNEGRLSAPPRARADSGRDRSDDGRRAWHGGGACLSGCTWAVFLPKRLKVGAHMIRLEKRPQPSRAFSLATPLLAVLATMFFGGLLFAVLGKDPLESILTIFWEPLFGEFAFYYRPQLLIKGAPLVLIAIGLSLGFKAGIWNIGAEGQYIMGALFGAGVGLAFYPLEACSSFR